MAYVGYNAAKKRANEKYLSKLSEIRIRMTPEEKRIIEVNAHNAGKSVNQYLRDLGINKG